MPTLQDVKRMVDKMDKLVAMVGPNPSPEVRLFFTQFKLRCATIGNALRVEHYRLTDQQIEQLPLSTELGPDSVRAFDEVLKWSTEEMKAGLRPVS